METNIQTQGDLEQLIGQYESLRVDFKASALLEQPAERIVKQLTEDVSAFANTEGGVIVIGISEGKSGKKSIASGIDEGVDPTQMPPERLEQLIASNISPPLPGLTVRPISLSGVKAGRVAYVVTVPKGTTAYQARHSLRYYGRTEFAASPLHDNVIRLLMERGRFPQAAMQVDNRGMLSADQELARRQSEQQKREKARGGPGYGRGGVPTLEYFEAPKRNFDEYEFQLFVVNTGEMTLRDFQLVLVFASDLMIAARPPRGLTHQLLDPVAPIVCGEKRRYRFADGLPTRTGPTTYKPAEKKLFPGDRVLFPEQTWLIHVPAGAPVERGSIQLSWTLHLDDARPTEGEIEPIETDISPV
jgi:Putative DNA-binding domain